jgi:ectoine hydroxylase-related dioxygenase (phytanoyl-CoA dioxygenase family)
MMPPVSEGNRFNGNTITKDVQAGQLILFPAWLRHSVPVNRSNAERISIAFNLMLKDYIDQASPPLWRGTVPIDPKEFSKT